MGRPAQFLLMAFLLAQSEIYAWTLASSLFLTKVGADALPEYYIFFAVITVPISAVFSGIIDRWPRIRIFQVFLVIFLCISLGLGFIANQGEWGCYAVYLGISVSCLMLASLYYIIFADYFTSTEVKYLTGRSSIAMALGGMSGGGLVSLLSLAIEPQTALMLTPILVALVLLHSLWLARREKPLGEPESAAEEGIVESLKLLPRIAKRYAIVPLLGAAIFFNCFLQCINEFLAFSIYEHTFTHEEELTAFLGIVGASLNIFGVLMVFFFTDRYLPKWGVARMNLFYPVANFLSFAFVAISPKIPAAVFAHANYDPFEHNLNGPVFTVNYNAVPHRFVGRVRVVNDGMIYPLALAGAGFALLALEGQSLQTVALIGVGGSIVLFLIHVGISKNYLHGLLDMLRKGSIDFSQVGDRMRLPASYADDIRAMLESSDPDTVALGLEMAARMEGGLSSADIGRALPNAPSGTTRRLLGRVSSTEDRGIEDMLRNFLTSPHAKQRALALEALAMRGTPPADLNHFLADPDEMVRTVAAAAILLRHHSDEKALITLHEAKEADSLLGAIAIFQATEAQGVLPLLQRLCQHPEETVRRHALEALAEIGIEGDAAVLATGREALQDKAPAVAAAASVLIVKLTPLAELQKAAGECLTDSSPDVRHGVAQALAARGEDAIPATSALLASPDRDVRSTAIEALGKLGGAQAEPALFHLLETEAFPAVERNLKLEKLIPANRTGWQPLAQAVADSNMRAVNLVLHVLGVLDCRKTVTMVRSAMKTSDIRMRANAVETLASMPLRRYILPLLPILERDGEAADAGNLKDPKAVLETALAAKDPWIQAAAAIAWHAEFGAKPALPADAARLAVDTVAALREPHEARHFDEEAPMNRLVFLKSLPIFAGLTFDNLMDVDGALTRETFLQDEVIVKEGDTSEMLYILFAGKVSVRKRQPDGEDRELAQLGPGQVFGEMGLFDGETRSASVVALEEVEMLSLDSDRFQSLVNQRPDVLMQLCRVLVGRLRTAIA